LSWAGTRETVESRSRSGVASPPLIRLSVYGRMDVLLVRQPAINTPSLPQGAFAIYRSALLCVIGFESENRREVALPGGNPELL
jgi:hypothetical protein